jgi:hypothetical protein
MRLSPQRPKYFHREVAAGFHRNLGVDTLVTAPYFKGGEHRELLHGRVISAAVISSQPTLQHRRRSI